MARIPRSGGQGDGGGKEPGDGNDAAGGMVAVTTLCATKVKAVLKSAPRAITVEVALLARIVS